MDFGEPDFEYRERRVGVLGFMHNQSFGGEDFDHHVADRPFVLHDENDHIGGRCSGSSCSRWQP